MASVLLRFKGELGPGCTAARVSANLSCSALMAYGLHQYGSCDYSIILNPLQHKSAGHR